jgi:hypothetical protein
VAYKEKPDLDLQTPLHPEDPRHHQVCVCVSVCVCMCVCLCTWCVNVGASLCVYVSDSARICV